MKLAVSLLLFVIDLIRKMIIIIKVGNALEEYPTAVQLGLEQIMVNIE